MKKLLIAFLLVAVLLVAVVSPALAYGPGNNGQGDDPSFGPPPPNDVFVPQKAYEARGLGDGNPPNVDSNGAIFHLADYNPL